MVGFLQYTGRREYNVGYLACQQTPLEDDLGLAWFRSLRSGYMKLKNTLGLHLSHTIKGPLSPGPFIRIEHGNVEVAGFPVADISVVGDPHLGHTTSPVSVYFGTVADRIDGLAAAHQELRKAPPVRTPWRDRTNGEKGHKSNY